MSGKWKNEVLMLVIRRALPPTPNGIETKVEVIRHAKSGGILASIKCSLDLSQLTACSIVKEENKTREHL